MGKDYKKISDGVKECYYKGEIERLSKTYPTPEGDQVFIYKHCGIKLPNGSHFVLKPKPGYTWTLEDLTSLLQNHGVTKDKMLSKENFVLVDDNTLFYAEVEDDGKLSAVAGIPIELSRLLMAEFCDKHRDVFEKAKMSLETEQAQP